MFFDGATRSDGARAGVVFVSPEKQVLAYSIVLNKLCSNNDAEYQALIIGLEMAQEMGIEELKVYGDSKLVTNQLLNVYEVKKDDLVPYFQQASGLLRKFEDIVLRHVPRKENRLADALANLATTLALSEREIANAPLCNRWILLALAEFDHEDTNAVSVSVSDDKDWKELLIDYLKEVASWPFDAWDLDVVGPISLKSSCGHAYILAATDYFSKWAEAVPLKEMKKETIVKFIRCNLIFRYEKAKYLRFESIQEGLTVQDNVRLRLEELETLDEKRLEAQQQLECYQAHMTEAFNKKVQLRSFQVGDLVLAIRRPIIITQRMGNKFTSKWNGSYVVKEVYTNSAYKLIDKDGLRIGPIMENF
ncbi:Ribonuclease H [Handroanthus impetiginosus]|uniref:Ribonuclease H n=1 Tax=Handroanthus impetiginosus TaxID=429701 RepID=A0A2G9H876_9LAMI|nr:Ribonuclease H [Handroanthus impetiginosus]